MGFLEGCIRPQPAFMKVNTDHFQTVTLAHPSCQAPRENNYMTFYNLYDHIGFGPKPQKQFYLEDENKKCKKKKKHVFHLTCYWSRLEQHISAAPLITHLMLPSSCIAEYISSQQSAFYTCPLGSSPYGYMRFFRRIWEKRRQL